MKGFKNTTRMQVGHNPSSAGRTVGRVTSFARGGTVRRFAEGGKVHKDDGEINGLDESWEHERHEKPGGNALVERDGPQVSEELEAGGGRSPLRPGYAAGGAKKEKHFHVHNHYHNGKKMPGKSKLKKMEMMATGGTIDRVKGGGKIHIKEKNKGKLHKELGIAKGEKIPLSKIKHAEHSSNPAERKRAQFADNARKFHHANGGHIIPEARDPDGYGDYATGGTINELSAGGGLYATGGTINELGVGGMPMRPVQAGGPPQGALAAMQGRARPPMPMRPGMPAPMQGGQARPLMRAAGGVARAKGGRSGLGSGVGRGAAHISGKGIAKSR